MSFLNPPAMNVNVPTGTPYMQAPPSNTLSYDPSMIAPTQQSMLGGINALGAYNTAGAALPQAWGIGQGMISDPNAQFAQSGGKCRRGHGHGRCDQHDGVRRGHLQYCDGPADGTV